MQAGSMQKQMFNVHCPYVTHATIELKAFQSVDHRQLKTDHKRARPKYMFASFPGSHSRKGEESLVTLEGVVIECQTCPGCFVCMGSSWINF